MRKSSISIAFMMVLISTVTVCAGTIDVKVTQIDLVKKGIVKIGLYDLLGFPVIGKDIEGVNLEVNGPSATHVFLNIPAGTYAISVIQDENLDGKLTKNFLGIPKEPYGFSKNKYGMFGPPAFENVSFEVENDSNISLTINLEK